MMQRPQGTRSSKHMLKPVLAAAAVALWLILWRSLDLATLLAFYGRALELVEIRPGAAVFGFAVLYILAVVSSLPVATFLTLAGASLFGTAIAFPVTLLSATAGACIVLIAARKLLYDVSMRRLGPWFERLSREFRADAASYLLLLRLAPVFPFFVVNLAAAVLGARLTTFAWTSLIGMLPGTLAYVLIGAGLRETFATESRRLADCRRGGQTPCVAEIDFSTLVSREILLGLAGLAALMLISLLVRRVYGRGGTGRAASEL